MAKTNVSEELAEKVLRIYKEKTVKESDVEEIKDLIDRGANVNTYRNEYGSSLLHCAVCKGISPSKLMEKIVKIIIKAGFKVNAINDRGESPLLYAVETGNMTFVKQLLDAGADVNLQSYSGCTALYVAVMTKNIKIAEHLINKGADLNAQDRINRDTPLHLSVKNNDVRIVKLLLKYKANPDIIDYYCYAPLHTAVCNNNKAIVELFLKNRANIEITSGSNCTPLFIAVDLNNKAITKMLLDNGAKVNKLGGLEGNTPLHAAVKNRNLAIAKLLVDAKANLKKKNRVGMTPLHMAAESGQCKLAKLLVQNGADPSIKDKEGKTPLHLAIENSREKLTGYLLGIDADQYIPYKNRHKLLYLAAHKGNRRIIKVLLSKGYDLTKRDSYGVTALDILFFKGHADILIDFFKNAEIINRHIGYINGCLKTLKIYHTEAYAKFYDHIQQLQTQATLDREDVHKSDATGFEYDI
ncbi:MAG: ankyrin repeat domain-containing protein [Synergistaceae bacterium]